MCCELFIVCEHSTGGDPQQLLQSVQTVNLSCTIVLSMHMAILCEKDEVYVHQNRPK